jgi:hypothetical protein
MALPVTIPNEFANATASIPLSQLDTNFTTLANAVNGISDGSETLANVTATVVNATTVDTTNIQVTNIKAKDNTAAGSIADSTGVVTLASSVLTTTDINGGTIDGTAIGGASAAAGSFTTLGASSTATFAAGAVGTPAITTTGDTNTGIFFPAADTIAFAEGGAEAMRIDSSGDVMIGATASNSAKLTISNAGAESIQFYPASASNVNQTLHYNRSATIYVSNDVYAADHKFFIQGNEKARIDSSGDVSVANGNLVFSTNGTGIDFSASAGGGASSSLLDDYEEGTWTPVYIGTSGSIGSTAYTTRNGTYTKIGNVVIVGLQLLLSNKGSWTGTVKITGLPFTAANDGVQSIGGLQVNNVTFADQINLRVGPNEAEILPRLNTSGAGGSFLQTTAVANNSEFYGIGIYRV